MLDLSWYHRTFRITYPIKRTTRLTIKVSLVDSARLPGKVSDGEAAKPEPFSHTDGVITERKQAQTQHTAHTPTPTLPGDLESVLRRAHVPGLTIQP